MIPLPAIGLPEHLLPTRIGEWIILAATENPATFGLTMAHEMY